MKAVKQILFLFSIVITQPVLAQVGVGIVTPDASSMMDVVSSNKGLLIPRVSLTSTALAGPVASPTASLMVYNIATAQTGTANAVTPGYYYWNGAAWVRITANGWTVGTSTATTNAIGAANSIGYLGTSTNSHLDLVSNNLVRGRLTNLGEFFIGTTNTAITGDLMGVVSNAMFPWASSGYSSFNGSGVYGSIEAGTTIFGGVQGEYKGTGGGAGVRGMFLSNAAGTNFSATMPAGVYGNVADNAGSYKFGVFGNGGLTTRTGGVLGNDFGVAIGALGYYASNLGDYSVYGFGQAHTNGGAGGRNVQYNDNRQTLDTNTNIGLGIYGGIMGGWVRGLKYGFSTKGETYSLYVDGKSFINEPMTYLMPGIGEERVAGYMVSSMAPEVNTKGKASLVAGKVYISFDENFKKVISKDPEQLMISLTPQGNTQGVYVDHITADGFWIIENNYGRSNVKVVWTATGEIKDLVSEIPEELLNKNFDVKMSGVMFNDNNTKDTPQPMWWDGTKMRWDTPPPKKIDKERVDFSRPQTQKN